jgi:hypothetical protein
MNINFKPAKENLGINSIGLPPNSTNINNVRSVKQIPKFNELNGIITAQGEYVPNVQNYDARVFK